jgi:hypothetical protein
MTKVQTVPVGVCQFVHPRAFAHPILARTIQHVPIFLQSLRQLRLLVCGLPTPTGHHTLGIAPPSASPEVLPMK